MEGEPKKEIEYETSVGDLNVIENILRAMEFSSSSSYEKFRTKIECGGAHITIDEYPYQIFVEIEGEEEQIKMLALELGFDLAQHIHLPADTLFNLWRKERGLPQTQHMRFDDFAI